MQTLGLNFSPQRATRLGLDPHDVFTAILQQIQARNLRLSLYWDELAPQPGQFDFYEIRWYLDRAQECGCGVLLTVGMTAQARPWLYPPYWLRDAALPSPDGRIGTQGRLAANLLLGLERGVAYLADYDAIEAWQVEPGIPEDAIQVRQPDWFIDPLLIKKETEIVREVDARHRPVLTGNPTARRGWRRYWPGPSQSIRAHQIELVPSSDTAEQGLWRHFAPLILQTAMASFVGRQIWITEAATVCARRRDAPEYHRPHCDGSPEEAIRRAEFVSRIGVSRIYLRGAESWLLMHRRGDSRWWRAAQELFQPGSSQRD